MSPEMVIAQEVRAEDGPASPPKAAKRVKPAKLGRLGAITLARHGEPGLSRKVRLSAAEYGAWWARYEETGLLPGQTPPARLVERARDAGVILSSTRIRSIETARAVVGETGFQSLVELIEAPLPPPHWPDWFKLSPRHWGFVTRVWWWFLNHHDGQESRAEAEARAGAAADLLVGKAAKGDDVLVLAHGFFNTLIGRALVKRGWKLVEDQGFKYWSMRRFEPRR